MPIQRNIIPKIKSTVTPAPSFLLQRKCACGQHTVAGGECAACRKKRLQRKAAGHTDPETTPPIVHEVLRSQGRPLSTKTQNFMESRFGYDFSGVRIHADAKAANSAKALHAFAYTVGTNVVFGERQYAPDTDTGRQLLTHELAHVVQQSKIPSTLHKANSLSQPSDAAEIEADAVAAKITKNFAVFGKSEANSQYQSSLSEGIAQGVYSPASPGVIYRRSWPWPFNGYVINNSDEPVTVWSDGRGLYTIAPGDSSGYFTEDVDHIMDRWGVWYKIGANTVTVDENGTVTGYKCVVFGPGDDCPPDIEGSHGDFPVPPGDTGFA